jgi:hypothetical protein
LLKNSLFGDVRFLGGLGVEAKNVVQLFEGRFAAEG